MHKQAGYQFAKTQTGFIAILHGTIVLQIGGDRMSIGSGGWETRSTAKAINGALNDAGVQGFRAYLQGGVLHVNDAPVGAGVTFLL